MEETPWLVSLSVLETLENESLLEKVAKKSEKIQLGLEKIEGIKKYGVKA